MQRAKESGQPRRAGKDAILPRPRAVVPRPSCRLRTDTGLYRVSPRRSPVRPRSCPSCSRTQMAEVWKRPPAKPGPGDAPRACSRAEVALPSGQTEPGTPVPGPAPGWRGSPSPGGQASQGDVRGPGKSSAGAPEADARRLGEGSTEALLAASPASALTAPVRPSLFQGFPVVPPGAPRSHSIPHAPSPPTRPAPAPRASSVPSRGGPGGWTT